MEEKSSQDRHIDKPQEFQEPLKTTKFRYGGDHTKFPEPLIRTLPYTQPYPHKACRNNINDYQNSRSISIGIGSFFLAFFSIIFFTILGKNFTDIGKKMRISVFSCGMISGISAVALFVTALKPYTTKSKNFTDNVRNDRSSYTEVF